MRRHIAVSLIFLLGACQPVPSRDPGALVPAIQAAMNRQESHAKTALERAWDHYDAGRLAEAEASVVKARTAAAGPREDAAAAELAGHIALRLGHIARARQDFGTSTSLDPDRWQAWLGAGRAADLQGDFAAARAAFDRALELRPGNPAVLNDLGMSHLAQNKPGAAAELFQTALAGKPDYALARANLRIAQAMLGDYKTALADVPTADRPDALNNVGYAAMLRGDREAAARYLSEALSTSPVYHRKAAANLARLRDAAPVPESLLPTPPAPPDATPLPTPEAARTAPQPRDPTVSETPERVFRWRDPTSDADRQS